VAVKYRKQLAGQRKDQLSRHLIISALWSYGPLIVLPLQVSCVVTRQRTSKPAFGLLPRPLPQEMRLRKVSRAESLHRLVHLRRYYLSWPRWGRWRDSGSSRAAGLIRALRPTTFARLLKQAQTCQNIWRARPATPYELLLFGRNPPSGLLIIRFFSRPGLEAASAQLHFGVLAPAARPMAATRCRCRWMGPAHDKRVELSMRYGASMTAGWPPDCRKAWPAKGRCQALNKRHGRCSARPRV